MDWLFFFSNQRDWKGGREKGAVGGQVSSGKRGRVTAALVSYT